MGAREPCDGDDRRASGADGSCGADHRHGRRREPSPSGLRHRQAPRTDADRRRDRAGRARALGTHVLAPDGRRSGLAGRRIRPAQAALRPPAAARARLLRPPADRPADVPRDRRSAGGALLPRLRARVHLAVDPHDRARGHRDDRDRTAPGPDLARAGAVRGADLLPLRAPRAPGDPGDSAAHRRADSRCRGEHLGGARRQGLRARAPPAGALPGQRRARVLARRWWPRAWKRSTTR